MTPPVNPVCCMKESCGAGHLFINQFRDIDLKNRGFAMWLHTQASMRACTQLEVQINLEDANPNVFYLTFLHSRYAS